MLSAANTGTPLTAEGVVALSTLRASAKRGGRTVGRFGVGFAAVSAVADDVVVCSSSGSVRFSRALTAQAVAAVPSLAVELASRGGRVPLLRLPFASDDVPEAGFDTEVRVVVRPSSDAQVRHALTAADPTLLLVLPGLSVLQVGDRLLRAEPEGPDVVLDSLRWRLVRAAGELDPALLADRPVEEQTQTSWALTWAVPVTADGVPLPLPVGVDAVVRAPTPTDDPLSVPAVLAASLPLGPDRRRVAPGALRDAVLHHAATALSALVADLAEDPARLTFVPGLLGAGEVDAALCSAVLRALSGASILPGGLRAADAVVLDGASPALVELLRDLLLGLLPSPWSASRWRTALQSLGVRRLDLAGLTEILAGLSRPPAWWRSLYDALPPDADQLGALPVPLSGGRLAPGPRGLVLSDLPVDLSVLGLPVVDPEAAHPLLLRLGAVAGEPRALVEDARVRAAVENALDLLDDGADVHELVQAVLDLVGAADLRPGELPWLASLPLPDTGGELRPAGELLLPDGPLAAVVDTSAGFGIVASGTAPDDVLAAVGVLRGFAVVGVADAVDADRLEEWLDTLEPGEEPGLVVRDLDLVRADAWPQALQLLGPDLTPYAVWWLARHRVLDGQRPLDLRLPESDPLLVGVLDVTRSPLAARLGARRSLSQLDPDELLDRLADPSRVLDRDQVRALHAWLARSYASPPDAVRAVLAPAVAPGGRLPAGGAGLGGDGRLAVVPAGDAVVVDRPDLLARVPPYAVVPVPLADAVALAEVLDLALASEVVPQVSPPEGRGRPWREVCGLDAPGLVVVHNALATPTAGGEQVPVSWMAVGDVDHVVGLFGTARALAWRRGDWPARHALLARLRGEAELADSDLDPA